MQETIKYLLHLLSWKNLFDSRILFLSIFVAVIEIIIFFLSAASLELFLSGSSETLDRIREVISNYVSNYFSIFSLLFFGATLVIFSILLNLVLLSQIKKKIISLGLFIQKEVVGRYLALKIDFDHERENRTDLKVFSESILVITEGILLQVYLALSRFIIVLIYSFAGILFLGTSFVFSLFYLSVFFGITLGIFVWRIQSITGEINKFGEKRLRVLTNFISGRIDMILFGLPKTLMNKMDSILNDLLGNKIALMTEVHKPRIFIEGFLIFLLIALGMFRLLNPDIELTTLTIFHILLTLRLLPALQQMTSNIRAAAASAWAIKDIQNLFNMSMRSKLSYRPKDLWDCRINFEKEDSNILEILHNVSSNMR